MKRRMSCSPESLRRSSLPYLRIPFEYDESLVLDGLPDLEEKSGLKEIWQRISIADHHNFVLRCTCQSRTAAGELQMNNKTTNVRYLAQLALLAAIEVVMKLMGLGSVPVGPLYVMNS